MAKTQEELIELKNEYNTLKDKLHELTEDELKLVTGGTGSIFDVPENERIFDPHFYPNNVQDFEPNSNK